MSSVAIQDWRVSVADLSGVVEDNNLKNEEKILDLRRFDEISDRYFWEINSYLIRLIKSQNSFFEWLSSHHSICSVPSKHFS